MGRDVAVDANDSQDPVRGQLPSLPPWPRDRTVVDAPVGGRLSLFLEAWSSLGDQWVSEVVSKGFRIPMLASPPLTYEPAEVDHSSEARICLRDAVSQLVQKKAVIALGTQVDSPGFYSNIFSVPKRDSEKRRMIHNLKFLNKWYIQPPPRFRLPTLPQLQRIVQPGDFMISLDLQDAYLHVPIHPDSQHLLRFVFEGCHYQWRVLPFGLSWGPWLFTRITQPVRKFLQAHAISCHMFIDDLLQHSPRRQLTAVNLQYSVNLLRRLGWIINLAKSDLTPTQTLQYIGGLFQTHLALLSVPQDRMLGWLPQLRRAISEPLSLREWQHLLGCLTACQDQTIRGRLHLRPLQVFLRPWIRQDDVRSLIKLPEDLRPHLLWWTHPENVLSGVSLKPFEAQLQLFVDASLQGWGAHLEHQTAAGLWSILEREAHINVLEFQAVLNAVRHWQLRLAGTALMIATDNSTVAYYIN